MKILKVRETQADLSWKGIPCCHQHGTILRYIVRRDYTLPDGAIMETESSTLGNLLEVSLLDLRPNTDYIVRVAGVNCAGIGVFSYPVALVTAGGKQK